jgi:hypothetical protein
MSQSWDQRTFPVTFQLCTDSKLDRIELHCSSNNWTTSLGRLLYAYKKPSSTSPLEYVYLLTLSLLPGHYEYKYKVNNKPTWVLNTEGKILNDKNILTKEDFIQLIVERCDLLERERLGETTSEMTNSHLTQASDNENTNVNYWNVGTSLFKNPILWDTELIVNQTKCYKAHRAVLSVYSDYFKTLFDKDNLKFPAEIQVEANDLSSFHIMLKFIYTGIIPSSLEHKQLKLLLQLANTYQIPTLVEIIQQNLANTNIDVNNCLRLLSMESELQEHWPGVRRSGIQIAAENFRYLCHQDEFLNLNYSIIQDILSHSSLQIPNKTIVSIALHRWLNAHTEIIPDLSRSITMLGQYPNTVNGASLHSSIVCYFADGSIRYTNMTINAINSFLRSTPEIMVGLLVHDDDTRDKVMSCIAKGYHYRILCKHTSRTPHFNDWNPTQYKLDILTFLDHGFDEIYWIDSDTVVYHDLTPYLVEFRRSSRLFYGILDHVMYDPSFVARWKQQHQTTFIPQACFMGFKSSCMRTFFALWKNAWKMWIEPKPFAMYQDPNPDFVGSMFCIEQYALGNAIFNFVAQESLIHNGKYDENQLILPIERKLILIESNERTELFYPSSKLQSMMNYRVYMSSCPFPFVLNTFVFKNSFYSSYNYQISKPCSMPLFSQICFSSGDSFIDSFFGCMFHFYNQNYQAGYEWYLKNFIKS